MHPPSFKGRFDCYLCARNRKRILFDYASEIGISTVAFGHHLDDFVETILINMVTRGHFAAMMPVQHFFDGKMRIIRPLCLVKEHTIERFCTELNLPRFSARCPNRQTNIRVKFKPIVKQLAHVDKHAREHIFNSPFHISKDYLPS